MTVHWLALIAYVGGGGALAIVAVVLVRRGERRLGPWPGASTAPRASGSDEENQVSAYLDRVTDELALPAADVAEVRAELADHLQDSIASLEAEGLDRETAVREALGRLGPAAELGRQIRAAHQSTRRLLAGAGGGVFAAGGGFVIGYLGGIAVALLLMLAAAACIGLLTWVGLPVPNLMADRGDTVNSLLYAITIMVAAATATRYAVRTSAGLSRRTPRSVAIFWAVASALVFGWVALFGLRGPQSWPGVAVELCVPVVAVAAAFVRIERPLPHVGRWAAAVLVVGVALPLLLGAAVSVSGPISSSAPTTDQAPDMHFDTVAPMAPEAWLPEGRPFGGGWGSESASSGTRVTADVGANPSIPMSTVLADWHDVRFEAWHALPDDPALGFGIDPHYSSPFAVQAAVIHDTSMDAVFHFERMRGAGSWWVLLTAVGPDGHRYRLGDVEGGSSSFNGSAWDWLTAPQ